jgi:hypothetical protein
MDKRTKRKNLELRLEALRGHIETNGTSPGFERELQRTEDELRAIPVEGTGAGAVRGPHGL